MATPSSNTQSDAIGLTISAVSKVLGVILAQHTLRLKDAANENAALDTVISPFDADLAQIANAYNTGAASADECISALQAVDQQVYSYLKTQVGKPGTAWIVPALGTAINAEYHADCNKSCTAGCCVYNNDLRPAIYGRNNNGTLLNLGLIQAITQGGVTVTVPGVAAPPNSAYGNFSRASYQIAIQKPPITQTAIGSINSAVDSLFGAPSPIAPASGTSPGVVSSLLSDILGGGVQPAGTVAPQSSSLKTFALIALAFLVGVAAVKELA